MQSVSQGILWPGEGEKDLEISTGGGRFFPFPTCTGIASLQLANLKPALLVINKPPEVIILMSKSKLRGPKRGKKGGGEERHIMTRGGGRKRGEEGIRMGREGF